MNRAEIRALKRVMHDERCGVCSGVLDAQAHEAFLISPFGEEFVHFVCGTCFREARSGPGGQRAVISRARLAPAPTEGRA
jgi:hypothetical protein